MKKLLHRLAKYNRIEIYVFGLIALMLVVKFLLITKLTTNTSEFLGSYKYLSTDSFDKLANGFGLFHNNSISFDNPGLPLMIKALKNIHLLFLLPLTANAFLFGILIYLYKLCRVVADKGIALTTTVVVSLNFTFNMEVNYISSEIYAVALITASLYYLIKKNYWLSWATLTLSMLFKNFAYFLVFIWAAFYIYENGAQLRRRWAKHDWKYLGKQSLIALVIATPVVAWHAYKLIKFGSPFYSRVEQFSLLKPSLHNVPFYTLNYLAVFGYFTLVVVLAVIIKWKEVLSKRALWPVLAGLIFNFIFWAIAYNWRDRRFLIYSIPFWYPLVAWSLAIIWRRSRIAIIFALLTLYPSILPLFSTKSLPLWNSLYAEVGSTKSGDHQILLEHVDGYKNPLMNLSPTIYSAIRDSSTLKKPNSSKYWGYSRYLESNYHEKSSLVCMNKSKGLKVNILTDTLVANKNVDANKIKFINCPGAN